MCTRDLRSQPTRMKDRHGQLDVAKVAGTLSHVLSARSASVGAVYATKLRVVQTSLARPVALLIHSFGVLDVTDAHILDFLRREQAELNLLNGLQRRARRRKPLWRHDCGVRFALLVGVRSVPTRKSRPQRCAFRAARCFPMPSLLPLPHLHTKRALARCCLALPAHPYRSTRTSVRRASVLTAPVTSTAP